MQRPFSETACMIKIPGQELNFVQRPLTKNHILHHKKMITKQLIPNAFLPNCLEDQKRASLFVIHGLTFPWIITDPMESQGLQPWAIQRDGDFTGFCSFPLQRDWRGQNICTCSSNIFHYLLQDRLRLCRILSLIDTVRESGILYNLTSASYIFITLIKRWDISQKKKKKLLD